MSKKTTTTTTKSKHATDFCGPIYSLWKLSVQHNCVCKMNEHLSVKLSACLLCLDQTITGIGHKQFSRILPEKYILKSTTYLSIL